MTGRAGPRRRVKAFVPPPPPKTPKSVGTRRRLLELAARLFIENGYEAVSMRDIASSAELTKGAVYGHFRSKGQLLVEVIRWKTSVLDEAIDFSQFNNDVERGVQLMLDQRRREILVLEVDAAAAARHDEDVAAGLKAFHAERHVRTRDAVSELEDPDTVAWVIAALEAGIGVKESSGLGRPDSQRLAKVIVTALSGLLQDER